MHVSFHFHFLPEIFHYPPLMATAGDSPPGFFPRVWYRLYAAASGWRRQPEASGNDANDDEEEEATVRARLLRRAAAARRVTRKLAFLSFNIEVLVFVYTFWRARRQNLTWRQPIQALPVLVVPALATLIYAGFIRFTRTLDHNDKKMLERRQEEKQETEGEPGEFNKKGRDSVQNCDYTDGASHSLDVADSMAHNSKVRKRRQSSFKLRDGGGDDTSWGHSKDFQPIPLDGLRKRRFSSGETQTTNISITQSNEEEIQKTTYVSLHSNQHACAPIYTEDIVPYHVDGSQHSRPVISSMLAEPANVYQELPAGGGEEERFDELWDTADTHSSSTTDNLISPVGSDHSFCGRDNSSLREHGVLLVKASEERSLYLPEKLELSPVFIKEAPASTPEYVSHSSFNDLTSNPSDPVVPASETFEKFHTEDFMEEELLELHKPTALRTRSFILEDIPTPCTIDDREVIVNYDDETYPVTSICSSIHSNKAILDIDTVTPQLSLIPQLLGEGVEKDSSKLHAPEGNITLLNFEEKVSVFPLATNNTEHCAETPESSLRSHKTEENGAAESISLIKASPEWSLLSSPQLVVEGAEEASKKETPLLNTKEHNDSLINLEKALRVEPVVSPTEKCFEISELSICSQDAKVMEVPGIAYLSTVTTESNYLAPAELLVEDDEDSKKDETLDLHLHEQKGLPFNLGMKPFVDPLIVDTVEDSLVTPEFFLYKEEVQMTEYEGVAQEVLSESEETFNHGKLAVILANDESNTQNLISNLMSAQFISDTNIKEALQVGEEASEKETPVLNTKEDNDGLMNFEEKVLQVGPVVSPTEQCFEISELSHCSQDAMVMEAPGFVYLPTVTPESNYLALPELLVEDEEDSREDGTLDMHLHEKKGLPFNLEMKPFVDPLIVDTAEDSLVTPIFLLCKEEVQMTEYEGVSQEVLSESEGAFYHGKLAVTFANDESNTQNLISNLLSAQFISDTNIKEALQVGEEASEKETPILNTKEENDSLVNLEEKALQVEPVVSPTEQRFEISELSHCSQDAMVMEAPGFVYPPTVTSESNYLASSELLLKDDEDSREDETLDLHLHEKKGLPINLEMKPFVDPLIVDTAEDSLVTPEFLLCKEEVQMTEYEGVAQDVLSESEGAFNHGKLVVTFPNYESNTQNLISNSMSAQFISDTNIQEALQVGQETLSQPPHESSCLSEGIFISSGEINNDELEVPAPFSGHRGFSNIEDEMAITPLDSTILLDEDRSAENRTDSSGSSPSIQDGKQAPSETLKEVTFHLEESLMSSGEGVKSEIFSLYSRSSSCVSEINTKETLKGGASTEPESDRGFSSDEQNPVLFHNMNSPESYTNNPMSTEFVLEDNMVEPLNVSDEETGGLQHEVSSTLPGAFVTPDVSNGMGQSDEHLDLLSFSFAPVVDALEPLQTGEGFSELQHESDFTFQDTDASPKEVNNAEDYFTNTTVDPQDDEKMETVSLQAAQQQLAEYQYEDVFTLDRTYVSPENTSVAECSFSADYASGFPSMVESHCISEKALPISQAPLNLEDILVCPDDSSKTENDLDNAKLSLCSTDVNLTEPLGNYQERTPQQQDQAMLGCDDIYMSLQEPTSENQFNNSGSQDIPDSIMIETLQGAERSPSKILHDGVIFSPKGMTSVSLDGGDDVEISCINPDSVMHPAFEPKYEKQKVDFEETSNFSSASSRSDINFVVTPQELPADPGSEKVSLKDENPKDGESEDMKDDVEDLDGDNENGPIDVSVDKIPAVVVPRPSVELYAEDASWRESTMGQSNDFEVFE